jgi:hypothetical protein
MSERCPQCCQVHLLRGYCPAGRAVINKPAQPTVNNGARAHETPAVINQMAAVTKMEVARAALTGAERQATWRASNTEKHRERSREAMRRKRVSRKAGAAVNAVLITVGNRG